MSARSAGPYGSLSDRLQAPSVRRMAIVAEQLGEVLRSRVVFIGAAILPLMESEDAVFDRFRSTDDVDAITITASYVQKGALDERLRTRGFRHDRSNGAHAIDGDRRAT